MNRKGHGSAAAVPARTVPESAESSSSPRFIAGAERRRAHDVAALAAAQPEALRATRRLVAVLEAGVSPAVLADEAQAALSVIAVLWETAARVADP